jgi:hypothetical protein
MEDIKGQNVSFEQILRFLHSSLNRYEPSFSSKMVATHKPDLPIWDKFVLNNTRIKAPPPTKDRMRK